MFLVAGLGNPGKQYEDNRHNIGFKFLDYLKEKRSYYDFQKKNNYLYIKEKIFDQDIIFIKPTTYMNLSGDAIVSAMAFFKILKEDIIVIYDDVALPVGKIRVREKGSDGGHNGLKNIALKLGTTEYKRIRIGVGAPEFANDMINHVLGNISAEEKLLYKDKVFQVVEDALLLLIKGNTNEAMNKVNGINFTQDRDNLTKI